MVDAFSSPALRATSAALLLGLAGASLVGCAASNKPAGDPTRMSESEVDIAVDLWQVRHQPREALDHGLKAVELDPDNADAAHLVALLYLDFCTHNIPDECRLEEAEKHARAAIDARDSFLEAQNTLAVVLVHQKRFDEAVKLLEPITANILYRTPEIAWGNLGWALLEKGDYQGAIAPLRRSVAAQPLFCVGNYRLGVAYRHAQLLEEARDALDAALETDAPGCNRMQDAYLERAQINLALGDLELTRANLDRCIGLARRTPAGRQCTSLLDEVQ